mgnify:CR=1 FL=1
MSRTQFSDLTIPAHFAQENDAFLIRHSKKLGFHANPERPAQSTTDVMPASAAPKREMSVAA